MRMIRMVNNDEGRKLRQASDERAAAFRELILGSRVVDVEFSDTWLNLRPVNAIILEKDGLKFKVTPEAEASWEGAVISWVGVRDLQTGNELADERP